MTDAEKLEQARYLIQHFRSMTIVEFANDGESEDDIKGEGKQYLVNEAKKFLNGQRISMQFADRFATNPK